MAYAYLIYGFAFVGLGLVLALQASLPVAVLPRRLLWFLAAFGFLHGAHEWEELATIIQEAVRGDGGLFVLRICGPLALALSFAILMQFGVETFVLAGRWPRWARAVPGALYVAWTFVFMADAPLVGSQPALLEYAEAVARWAIGFPAALVAAAAMLFLGRVRGRADISGFKRYLSGAAVALVAYAVLAGLLVVPEPLEPGQVFTLASVASHPWVPTMLRAVCAVVIGVLLSLALVVETAKIRVQVAERRLHDEFIAAVAHDLRSSLGAVEMGVTLLERRTAQEEGARTTLRNIHNAATRLVRMIDDLTDVALIESRQLTIRREPVDLPRLVQDVVDRHAEATPGHPVRLVAPAFVPRIEVDPGRLEQILTNLLSNAAKYSTPKTEIRVDIEARPSEAVISVTNLGKGITEAERPHLFSRYFRGEAAAGQRGLGLGLYMVQGLVSAHGGRIWVDSEVGQSTSVRFTLPFVPRREPLKRLSPVRSS